MEKDGLRLSFAVPKLQWDSIPTSPLPFKETGLLVVYFTKLGNKLVGVSNLVCTLFYNTLFVV